MKTMKMLRNLAALAAALLLALTLCVTAFGDSLSYGDMAASIVSAEKAQLGIADGAALLTEENFPAGSSVSDWTALAMARAGIADDYAGYLARLQAYVERQYAENGGLHAVKATEYHRIALTAAALGGDPTAFGTKPDGTAIDLVAEGTYNWQGDDLGGQGLNGWIFALLTVDAVGAEVPADARYSRQDMLDAIVSAQLPEGGFSLGGGEMDVDITAMALQALAPYQQQYPEVIDAALNALSAAQTVTGGFESWGAQSSESCAQVICGLIACGVNPDADARFNKNGSTPLDALMSFYDEKVGGFRHVNTASGGYEPVVNQMATEQAYYALAHYYAAVPSKASLSKAAKAGSGKIKLSWKKAAVNTDYVTKKSGKTAEVSGYQIVLATDKKFSKNVEKVNVKSAKTLSKTVTGLKKGKTYYVKLRAYKTVNGKKIYGQYSSVKTQKV